MLHFHPVGAVSAALSALSTALVPIGGAVAAIIALTIVVRLAIHPLARAAVRGERARARLAPQIAKLQARHRGDLARLGTELSELHRRERVSPLAGVWPLLVQAPILFVLYGALRDPHRPLAHAYVFGVPLNAHLLTGGGTALAHIAVFAVLFFTLAMLAWLNSRRARMLLRAATPAAGSSLATAAPAVGLAAASPAVTEAIARYAPYAVLIPAVVLPLAVGVYLVTTTAWTTVENVMLRRGLPERVTPR